MQVAVSFDGPAAPPTPLTWGQRALWKAYRQRGRQQMNNLRRILTMPPQAPDDVDSVLRALATLVGRYSSLRTRLHLADGEPRQVVAASGELPVRLVEVDVDSAAVPADGDSTSAAAREVAEQLAATPFDHAVEWPQRVALVLVDERVRQIVVVFSHTTVDLLATGLVVRELRLLLLDGAISTPPRFLNDIRQATDAKAFDQDAGEAEVRAAMRRSSFAWAERLDRYAWRARVEIFDMPAAIGIALTADTGHLPPDAIERFLHDLEALLVNAAFHDLPWPWTSTPVS